MSANSKSSLSPSSTICLSFPVFVPFGSSAADIYVSLAAGNQALRPFLRRNSRVMFP